MAPSLISSAAGKKTTGPKAPARRRPAAPAPPPEPETEPERPKSTTPPPPASPAPSAPAAEPPRLPTPPPATPPPPKRLRDEEEGAQPSKRARSQAISPPSVEEPTKATIDPPPPKRPRDEPGETQPAKRAKRSSTRSNAKVQAEAMAPSVEESTSATVDPPPPPPPSKKRKAPSRKTTTGRTTKAKAKSAATITNSDDEGEAVPNPESPEDEEASVEPQPKKQKQRLKKKQVRIARIAEVEGEEARGEEAGADGQGEGDDASNESDPELHEIDPNTLSMYDLSRESRYGKQSERGKKMAEIDWDEVMQKRRAEAQAIVDQQQEAPAGEVVQSVEGPDGNTESQPGDAEQAQAAPANNAGAGNEEFLVDADGNIVLDESTVRHDATAQAMEAAETGAVEDANDLTAHMNRTTWINNNRRDPVDRVPLWKWKSDPWSEEETDRFYEALRMFGSDFFIISKMFPGKNRRMIKAKFTREEKLDPQRITGALTGKATKRIDLEHYSRETGRDMSVFTKYDGLEHAQGIINESMKDKHEAMTAAAEQEAAAREEKERREKEEKKEKSKTAKKARKQRAKAGGTLGGVPDDGGD